MIHFDAILDHVEARGKEYARYSVFEQKGIRMSNGSIPAETPSETGRPDRPGIQQILWRRKGPIAMAICTSLTMVLIFVNWMTLEIHIPEVIEKSGSYSGWGMILPQALFFLLIIPLVLSILMSLGIGTKRRVLETCVISFVSAFYFLVLIMCVGLTVAVDVFVRVIDSKAEVLVVEVQFVPWFTIALFVIFILGLIFTNVDRGRELGITGRGSRKAPEPGVLS